MQLNIVGRLLPATSRFLLRGPTSALQLARSPAPLSMCARHLHRTQCSCCAAISSRSLALVWDRPVGRTGRRGSRREADQRQDNVRQQGNPLRLSLGTHQSTTKTLLSAVLASQSSLHVQRVQSRWRGRLWSQFHESYRCQLLPQHCRGGEGSNHSGPEEPQLPPSDAATAAAGIRRGYRCRRRGIPCGCSANSARQSDGNSQKGPDGAYDRCSSQWRRCTCSWWSRCARGRAGHRGGGRRWRASQ